MSQKTNFRQVAAARLAQAMIELQSGNDERLKYAVLELRMAIEGVTYDRATAYKDDIPPSDFGTWQPKKLMQLLLDIEPYADQTSTFSFNEEIALGVPSQRWHSLGTDNVFSLKSIKSYYDMLGSYLHVPTLKQIQSSPTPDPNKLRTRCNEIVRALELVLASPIYNVTFANVSSRACDHCGEIIRKRIPLEQKKVEAQCFNCSASYLLEMDATSKQVEWTKLIRTFKCRSDGCTETFALWRGQLKVGTGWKCPSCKTTYRVDFGLVEVRDAHR